MTSTGFMVEKLYGSIWQVCPTIWDVERAIQFYEPHLRGKLTFIMVRRIGRRLKRTYGWMGLMIVSKKGWSVPVGMEDHIQDQSECMPGSGKGDGDEDLDGDFGDHLMGDSEP
ncbi:hypothetical protein NEUTE1DRAFT_140980 [Neurospora tetrasperma FGSC 2508]|uniref:Uncharacterized protein n=1 Tax=Neurospora tetrasperma (strain FGSC 2508 / ATCC MYA-4615 / P0657) TaxID=510951 RepID=F8MV67_NEUT8|nr:uncharacterized protein NEUTE1DRAFT_140980 [Neurospora tetrasperma FGSC 2508]EGO54692.1 hypothetical protein NEUTE1DRAFT_140980 [Neurospora tetrasperma FGSC 2508]EGZ67833.1 hypothetical protein NEUTE2DRAFT_169665 [Neurospora tetrasperma FGSC 2509]